MLALLVAIPVSFVLIQLVTLAWLEREVPRLLAEMRRRDVVRAFQRQTPWGQA